jgi:hypothetical protein
MSQTAEAESLDALVAQGKDLARQLQRAHRPSEMLTLARQINATWGQLLERVRARDRAPRDVGARFTLASEQAMHTATRAVASAAEFSRDLGQVRSGGQVGHIQVVDVRSEDGDRSTDYVLVIKPEELGLNPDFPGELMPALRASLEAAVRGDKQREVGTPDNDDGSEQTGPGTSSAATVARFPDETTASGLERRPTVEAKIEFLLRHGSYSSGDIARLIGVPERTVRNVRTHLGAISATTNPIPNT